MIANASVGQAWPALIMLALYLFLFALMIICLIRVSTYCMTAGKERQRTRIELGKLAEEVRLLRQEVKGSQRKDPSPPATPSEPKDSG
jgi:hypothetical protein